MYFSHKKLNFDDPTIIYAGQHNKKGKKSINDQIFSYITFLPNDHNSYSNNNNIIYSAINNYCIEMLLSRPREGKPACLRLDRGWT